MSAVIGPAGAGFCALGVFYSTQTRGENKQLSGWRGLGIEWLQSRRGFLETEICPVVLVHCRLRAHIVQITRAIARSSASKSIHANNIIYNLLSVSFRAYVSSPRVKIRSSHSPSTSLTLIIPFFVG